MSHEQYRGFAEAYGYDVYDWPGLPVLRAIRELTMTTWLMQLVEDPRAAAEFHRRVDDIRSDRFPRRWRPFQQRDLDLKPECCRYAPVPLDARKRRVNQSRGPRPHRHPDRTTLGHDRT